MAGYILADLDLLIISKYTTFFTLIFIFDYLIRMGVFQGYFTLINVRKENFFSYI